MKIFTTLFDNDEAKNRFINEVLRAELGFEPRIVRTPSGKPVLAEGGLHFSVAHSKRLLVLATADEPVGVDVECLRPFPEGVKKSRFMKDCPDGDREAFCAWTRKEAAVKCTGEGMKALADVDTDGFKWYETESVFDGEDEYVIAVCTRKEEL